MLRVVAGNALIALVASAGVGQLQLPEHDPPSKPNVCATDVKVALGWSIVS
jgi:hypothetical protein